MVGQDLEARDTYNAGDPTGDQTVHSTIYRARAREYTYLFVRSDFDLAELPEELAKSFDLEVPVMELELSPERKLFQEDVSTVLRNLASQGYHLQLPPEDDPSGWLDLPPKRG